MISSAGLRRALHAASTLLLLLVPLAGVTSLRFVLVGIAGLACVLEGARLSNHVVRGQLERLVPVFRPREARRPSGATWLAVGYALAALLPWPGALAGILVGGLADPAASLVGGRWGRGAHKSTAGSAGFFVIATAALSASGVRFPLACIGGAATALVERFSGPVDDNLLVPIAAALVMVIFA